MEGYTPSDVMKGKISILLSIFFQKGDYVLERIFFISSVQSGNKKRKLPVSAYWRDGTPRNATNKKKKKIIKLLRVFS